MVQPGSDGSGMGATSSMYYDADGRQVATRDANGNVNGETYDALGDVTAEIHADGGVVLDRLRRVEDGNVSIVYDYDANGNRTHIHTQYEDVNSSGTSQDQYFTYDTMNRETAADLDKYGDITQSQGHRMTYDLNGNRISDTSIGAVMGSDGKKTPGTVVQNYTYDSLNRLVMTKYNGAVIDQRQYDADGRVVLSGLGGASQSFYDTLGLSDQVQFNLYDGAGGLPHHPNNKSIARDIGTTSAGSFSICSITVSTSR